MRRKSIPQTMAAKMNENAKSPSEYGLQRTSEFTALFIVYSIV